MSYVQVTFTGERNAAGQLVSYQAVATDLKANLLQLQVLVTALSALVPLSIHEPLTPNRYRSMAILSMEIVALIRAANIETPPEARRVLGQINCYLTAYQHRIDLDWGVDYFAHQWDVT